MKNLFGPNLAVREWPLLIMCLLLPVLAQSSTNRVVAVLGSWSAKGHDAGGGMVSGSYALGYAGLLTATLQPLGWGVTNLSVGGQSTTGLLGRFETEVVPAATGQIVFGLSLADEGLAGAADPAAVCGGFYAGWTGLVNRARAENIFPVMSLCEPCNSYSPAEYAYVKAMNRQINAYDLPCFNVLGAVDDGQGHWVSGYADALTGRPNALGHQEMFYTIVPSLFDAVRLGKSGKPGSVREEDGCAIITRDTQIHDPLRFVPDDTVHAFTTAFRVRSACTGTVAAVSGQQYPWELRGADRILVDFGPLDIAKGHAAPSPDPYGHHWNSWRVAGGVMSGTVLTNLIRTSGAMTHVGLEVTAMFDGPNGGSAFGGLMAPDPALLGDLAVPYATEDYFGTGATGKFKLRNLRKGLFYTLRFFGSRANDDVQRVTGYTAVAGNGTYSTNLVTTGTDVGAGGYDGNNNTVAELKGLSPDASGEIEVSVTKVSGYGYLNIMELRVEELAPLAASERILVDFGPSDTARGRPAPSPDHNGNYWNNWRGDYVLVGTALPSLVRTSGALSAVALEVTAMFAGQSNGRSGGGGLMAPDPALLGDFAVTNAVEDYFCTGDIGAFKIKGLNPRLYHTLRFFGSRSDDDDQRITAYTAVAGNGTYTTNLVTTGTDVGAGGYDGNNNTIVALDRLLPNVNGEIEVKVSKVSLFAYLNCMEIAASGEAVVEDPDPGSLLIDLGPDDGVNGHAMSSPDSNGRHWNAFVYHTAPSALNNLVDASSGTRSTVSLTITKSFISKNGIGNGGLLEPDPALLGSFAQPRATEDYFHTQTGGSALKISGLNKASVYALRFFGTRESPDIRETRFAVKGGNGTYTADLVTSGTDVGAGGYDGNNDTIAELTGLAPDASGCLEVDISNVQGVQCYLGVMEIRKERSVAGTGWGTVEFRTDAIAYVGTTGHEIKLTGGHDSRRWYDVAVAHCYAAQKTWLFVDGAPVGWLSERLAPTAFVLGGEGAASAERMEGPEQAWYQDWCVYRSAWNADEAAAHASGETQQASMEICAPLSDRRFVPGAPVENRAQSLSKAVVNSASMEQQPRGTIMVLR